MHLGAALHPHGRRTALQMLSAAGCRSEDCKHAWDQACARVMSHTTNDCLHPQGAGGRVTKLTVDGSKIKLRVKKPACESVGLHVNDSI